MIRLAIGAVRLTVSLNRFAIGLHRSPTHSNGCTMHSVCFTAALSHPPFRLLMSTSHQNHLAIHSIHSLSHAARCAIDLVLHMIDLVLHTIGLITPATHLVSLMARLVSLTTR